MCVCSDGNPYGIDSELIFSFPVTVKNGEWTIKEGHEFSPEMKEAIKKTEEELISERNKAKEFAK
ncbi:hypothetical protein MHBO_000698 [Bonamia ostreae]|uniref:Lactate/malate dehydrogenase C-terminal domain-containing protein n=1 Tax=Bonamia ostreae TaxID=126728 RepID=A0ABV2AH67_9EUKA